MSHDFECDCDCDTAASVRRVALSSSFDAADELRAAAATLVKVGRWAYSSHGDGRPQFDEARARLAQALDTFSEAEALIARLTDDR